MLFQPLVLLIVLTEQGTQTAMPSCAPERGRRAEQIRGEMTHGRAFSKSGAGGWILKLVPSEHGWLLEVTTKGWHFRNEDNTGPNNLSMNASQELREFIFSPEVGRGIEYNGSGTTADDVAKVESFGRGWLHVDGFRLTPFRKGERASFEWIKFSACLTWPAG